LIGLPFLHVTNCIGKACFRRTNADRTLPDDEAAGLPKIVTHCSPLWRLKPPIQVKAAASTEENDSPPGILRLALLQIAVIIGYCLATNVSTK
jgi:hypothetical protein